MYARHVKRSLALCLAAACTSAIDASPDGGGGGGHGDGATGSNGSGGSGSGSGGISTLTPGQSTISLTAGGQPRTAILYVPTSATPTSQLAIALHGNGDTAGNFLATSGLEALADADGTVLIIPQGITRSVTVPAAGGQTIPGIDWDGYNAAADGNIDLPLLDALRTQIVATHQVDAQHVFVFGYSQGGYLAFEYGMVTSTALSCTAVLAASAAFGGGANDPQIAAAQRKLGVVLQIGTNDSAFPQAQTTAATLTAKAFPSELESIQGAGHVPIPGDVSVPWAFCRGKSL